jgi:hypothetical protein
MALVTTGYPTVDAAFLVVAGFFGFVGATVARYPIIRYSIADPSAHRELPDSWAARSDTSDQSDSR